ncbi:MAG: MmcQ/YjbR family DNA-binding protein [Faecalibacterium sp.]|nr:MmcQ/YjbR family DNA-binding protein [Faecalibacterium sp.]
MPYPWLNEYLMAKPGATQDLRVDRNWLRYRVGSKLFAAAQLKRDGQPLLFNFKLEPLQGDLLRRQYPDIGPGYYMNKLHWNALAADGTVPDELVRQMADTSYALVLKSLPKQLQADLLACRQP